jgi:ribosome maturation factor RimP
MPGRQSQTVPCELAAAAATQADARASRAIPAAVRRFARICAASLREGLVTPPVLSWADSFRAGPDDRRSRFGKWARARFFFAVNQLQTDIETRVAGVQPDVEVLLAELSGTTLRVYIDHPAGVSVAHCEQVSRALEDLRDRYTIEVSSPGPRRPLAKPEHFRRFVGRRARVRIAPGCESFGLAGTDSQRHLTGELVGASQDEVTLAVPEGVVAIPYTAIERSHLVEE